MLAQLFLGFASGLPLLLTLSTLTVWLAESGVSKTAIGLFALVGAPYTFKFLWAPLIDRLPLPPFTSLLGRRRGWMVATQLGLVASLLGLGASDPTVDAGRTALFAVLVAFFSASQDIVIDAYRVESLSARQQGAGAGILVFGYRMAMLIAGAGALYLASFYGWFATYAIMSGLVLVGMATILLSPEPAQSDDPDERQRTDTMIAARGLTGRRAALAGWLYRAVIAPFADFMRSGHWVVILLFIVLYKFGDALAGVMANPFYIEMGFSKIEIANISKLFGLVATLAGGLLGGIMVARLGLLKSLLVCGFLQMASNLMFAVQAMAGYDLALLTVTIGLENFTGGMGTAAFVAYLSSLCNVAYTATQYALLSSFMAFARTILASSGGWIADHVDWVSFFLISTAAAVPGLLVLVWMMRVLPPPMPRATAPGIAE
ncbi:MAG: AmpG family muropeptide MFS transporter [Alphaproteobacteria bacterium]|nr:AmpG family muropeptide MFS transporter [Alphaproteobacteria bacterium]MBU0796597.1 AmpG family muropeptide MFS transporter [Alphaproteobacteria bacterium]MBU0886334.1 AmpG family muropeptide MFS transporter [Alphaproteobacteria bacterium]MBU1813470.1 AmpG family muropeptide MFS transporter [Alphaproteobacteria bacterium]MBU2090223.1 AmpG family muropeptide MFS transporter [Alphaproteobacteria bacterium]